MNLAQAKSVAQEIVARLKPHCQPSEVVGSIRRGKSWVRDIDIVLIPPKPGKASYGTHEYGQIQS